MPPTRKRPSKRSPPSTNNSNPNPLSPHPSSSAQPTTPYTSPSPALTTLLSTFPQEFIYILHLDSTPPSHRKQLFALPLIFNTLLVVLLLWRTYHAFPTYLALFAAVIGYPSSEAVNFKEIGLEGVIWILVERMGMFFLDGIVLGRYVAEWPIDFFWGARLGSALGWRWRVGFAEAGREVVVRRSRRWADSPAVRTSLYDGGDRENCREEKHEKGAACGEVAEEKVLTAVRREWVREKSGLLMIDKDWDLYYRGMVSAHDLLSKGSLKWEELEKGGPVVCVYRQEKNEEEGDWLIRQPWEDDDSIKEEAEGGKLRVFKDILTAMGKENLFFRWVEVMQYESSTIGAKGRGMTRERRERMVQVSRDLFEGQGVNWDEVIDGIGGVDGLPGMEITS
ncbi:MAG: hypothetical protein Q9166_006552 [cf. Caloplaca sp. 2 TL-2023]